MMTEEANDPTRNHRALGRTVDGRRASVNTCRPPIWRAFRSRRPRGCRERPATGARLRWILREM